MKTLSGKDIPESTRGIFYVCKFDYTALTLEVTLEALFDSAFDALNVYANTPNPESQLVTGKTYEELVENVEAFNADIKDPEWLLELSKCL